MGARRFTDEQIRAIRKEYDDETVGLRKTHTMRSLGLRYGVSNVAIFKIVNRISYKDVPNVEPEQ